MKKCPYCNITINTDEVYCPLCFGDLEGVSDNKQGLYEKRLNNNRREKNSHFVRKLFLFLSIAISLVSILFNILFKGPAISLLIIASIIYIWILVAHTIISNRNIFEKILFQFIGVWIVLYISQKISCSTGWLLNFVIPFIAIGVTIVLNMSSFISPSRKKLALPFLLFHIFLFILSIIMLISGLDTFKILNQISAVYSIISIIGLMLFQFKVIKYEFTKRFHL